MSRSQINLQEAFLNQIRRDSVPITMYLVNGVQLKGVVKGFDSFTVVLENDGKQSMVYKHAVSTITPLRPVEWQGEPGPDQ
jgi:host factor-I protein